MSAATVVIGNFDGVHPGHREVLAEAGRRRPDLPLVVVTFWPHPMSVLRPETGPMLLTSLEARIELLTAAGADRVEVIEFTREFASWSPSDFVERVLVPLDPAVVVVGENFRFGHHASGTVATLTELSAGRFEVEALPLVRFGDEDTCSTLIRRALAVGDVAHAAHHLGRLFNFRGVVAHGDRRGRTLGFPTANLPVPADLACPEDGVYAGWVTRRDGLDAHGDALPADAPPPRWPAAISVGTNPTFDGLTRRVESYVLDRDDLELYDAPISVEFVARIRGQVRFADIDELVVQMVDDVARCREQLGIAPRQ
ncbi:bifunctional riboflavin kinase/FAD synthetase [Propionicimonas sp.]|uniref:bifunctional riboflavin kinase/FAD synthetase n=1 Tax=Propionicimonas sp. TaxID=1955623 RepID=UPI0039E4C4A4